jgi:hypothetical protein
MLNGGHHLGDLVVDGRLILKYILGNMMRRCGLHSTGSGYSPVPGFYILGNEPTEVGNFETS